jgi:osmotically-inducible protein OsmY
MGNTSPDPRLSGLMAALESDPRIDMHQYPVRASIREGRLVLEGTVKNVAAKKLACSAARRVAADAPISDRLRVAAAEPKEDGALRDEVANMLLQEPVFLEYGLRIVKKGVLDTLREPQGDPTRVLNIQVSEGTVTLSGNVGSLTHQRLAEALTWWTAGCQAVENELQVTPPEEDNDGELADAVLMMLEKDPLVHAGQVLISVKNRMVTLDGYVASQEEKHLAVMDAWCVPGVEDVIDHIEARI